MSTADQKLGSACGMQCAMLFDRNFPTLAEIQSGNHNIPQWLMAYISAVMSAIYTAVGPQTTLNLIEWLRGEVIACRLRESFDVTGAPANEPTAPAIVMPEEKPT